MNYGAVIQKNMWSLLKWQWEDYITTLKVHNIKSEENQNIACMLQLQLRKNVNVYKQRQKKMVMNNNKIAMKKIW